MQLARDLHKTRKELLQNIDSKEMSDWIAFYIYSEQKKKEHQYENEQKVLQAKFKTVMGGKLNKA